MLAIKPVRVRMVADPISPVEELRFPAGYHLRYFRPGEEGDWAEIETAAGEFASVDEALARFNSEFAPHLEQMQSRCLFLVGPDGRLIGTATAWWNDEFRGGGWGRLHWVGIHRDFQGLGLARPLVVAAVNRLAQLHERAYLTSKTTSLKAIKLYLDYGFSPDLSLEGSGEGWQILADLLQHPKLQAPTGK